jgi:aldehyde dehydrogenase (NAD+)
VCGNTVVIKPAEDTPLSTYNFVSALSEAGIPPGVLNIVAGRGVEVGKALLAHEKVRLVSFTGSTEVDRIVGQSCAATDKICSLEMGGKNVIMIMEDADLDLALEGVLWGAFGTTGQRCTATSRVVVHRKVAKKFTNKLADRAKQLRLGPGLNEKTDVGPVINRDASEKILEYVEEKAAGFYGGSQNQLRNFVARLSIKQLPAYRETEAKFPEANGMAPTNCEKSRATDKPEKPLDFRANHYTEA